MLLVSKKGFSSLKQVLNLDEEEAINLDIEGELMENKVLVVPP